MNRPIAFLGQRLTLYYARTATGKNPAQDFVEGLDRSDSAKIYSLFRLLGDTGQILNHEKCKSLGSGLFELKSFQIRILFAYDPNEKAAVLLTHGFTKKQQKTPREEIARALRILEEDRAARSRLKVVPMRKRRANT